VRTQRTQNGTQNGRIQQRQERQAGAPEIQKTRTKNQARQNPIFSKSYGRQNPVQSRNGRTGRHPLEAAEPETGRKTRQNAAAESAAKR